MRDERDQALTSDKAHIHTAHQSSSYRLNRLSCFPSFYIWFSFPLFFIHLDSIFFLILGFSMWLDFDETSQTARPLHTRQQKQDTHQPPRWLPKSRIGFPFFNRARNSKRKRWERYDTSIRTSVCALWTFFPLSFLTKGWKNNTKDDSRRCQKRGFFTACVDAARLACWGWIWKGWRGVTEEAPLCLSRSLARGKRPYNR